MNKQTDTESCESYELLISCAMDDESTAEESRRLEEHLAACASCRAQQKKFENVNQAVFSLGQSESEILPAGVNVIPPGKPAQELTKPAPAQSLFARRQRMAGWAALVTAAMIALVLLRPDPELRQKENPIDILGPVVSLTEINSQRMLDQELLIESLELDLRTLKLQLAVLNDSGEDEVLGKIDALMQKIDQVKTSYIN